MKYQDGLLHRGDRQAKPEDLALFVRHSDNWNAEISGAAVRGPLVMTYRGARITWEDETEVQPVRYGPYILTFDGRLDNREEIAGRISSEAARLLPDPDIVALAYEKYGDGILPHLVGEFALVLWCQASRTLLFARSVCGTRPLYYVLDKQRLMWSSDFAHLVRISGVDLEINDSYMLEYLVSQPSHKHSPLLNVNVVQAGTSIRFADDQFQPQAFLWDPNSIRPVRYRADSEYEEQLREKLEEAVRVRLRSRTPVFSELSGGLDSSTLVLTADSILRSRNEEPENLRTVSCVFEESESCDERPFMRSVEEQRGVPTFYVSERDQRITLGLTDIEFTGKPNPLHCHSGRYPTFASLMKQFGSRVLFSGEGGDHLFWSVRDGAPVIAEELALGHLRRMHREAIIWSRASCIPYARLLGRSAGLALGSILPGFSQYEPPKMPKWLCPVYRRQFRDKVYDANSPSDVRGTPGFRAHFRQVESLFSQLSAGYLSEYREIYVTYPYSHRPLVEFCLGVPISQFLRNGETRSLMRRAFRHLLPAKVLRRQSKGAVDECFARALDREWDHIGNTRSWELCRRGIVDPDTLYSELKITRLGLQSKDGNLLRLVSLERWLRSLRCVRATTPNMGNHRLRAQLVT